MRPYIASPGEERHNCKIWHFLLIYMVSLETPIYIRCKNVGMLVTLQDTKRLLCHWIYPAIAIFHVLKTLNTRYEKLDFRSYDVILLEKHVYVLKGENELFRIRMRKKLFLCCLWILSPIKKPILRKWRKKSKILKFLFFLCRIVTGQNVESYTVLERIERPVDGV